MKQAPNNGGATTVSDFQDAVLDRREMLAALQRVRAGDFSARLPSDWSGLDGKIADTFNEIVAANQRMAEELRRVGQVVGKEGRPRERARFDVVQGAWGEMETSVNTLIEDLLRPTTEVTGAIAAVAQGDLRQTMRLDVDGRPLEGEFLRSATIVNTMIQQLGVFTSEVTRVALSRFRRKARWSGRGARRIRCVEGPHRIGELDGIEPHCAGSKYFRSNNCSGQR